MHGLYRLFGLLLDSELDLPELDAVEGQDRAIADIRIRCGTLDFSDLGAGLRAVDRGVLLDVPGVARFWVREGTVIIVEPASGVAARDVRLFLLGSAFGALLHQRGLLPLHANAVEVDGAGVAFMGTSGSGKSTLAAWFHDRGIRVLADDVCAIHFDHDGEPIVFPGLPRLRLWIDAIRRSGRAPDDFSRSYVGDAALLEKFDVPMALSGNDQSAVRLGAIYLLDRGEALSIERLEGVAAADAVIANTYRGAYLSAIDRREDHWRSAIRLVQAAPVFRLTRPWDLARLDEVGTAMLDHTTAVGSRSA
jgi:hypothetical protein